METSHYLGGLTADGRTIRPMPGHNTFDSHHLEPMPHSGSHSRTSWLEAGPLRAFEGFWARKSMIQIESRPVSAGKSSVEDSSENSSVMSDEVKEELPSTSTPSALKGWRLQILTASLCLGLFLSTLESTIVSTSLLAITEELQDFSRSSWIVSAYLLTCTGFVIPLAKLSDIYSRRTILAVSLVLFIAFSAGCGWSQSMLQLCVFRAFQGIGGGGIYGMTFVILPEMVTPERYPRYTTIISATFALSNLLGPIVGGAINNHTTWRWVFWLNIPAGVIALVLSLIAIPSDFPYQNDPAAQHAKTADRSSIKRIDFIGAFFMLATSILFVAALETGGIEYDWNSATPLSLLLVSAFCLCVFSTWQWHLGRRAGATQESVFPWRVLTNRFAMGALLNTLFVSVAFVGCVIDLPLRFQIVSGDSPLTAGYRLLAMTVATPLGSSLCGLLVQRACLPFLHVLLIGGAVQTLGLALYTGLDAGVPDIRPSQYALQALIGLGFGVNIAAVILATPHVFEKRDMAVGMGAVGQFRFLGGAIGTSGSASILLRVLKDRLDAFLPADKASMILENTQFVAALPPAQRAAVRDAYIEGFRDEMIYITALSALAFAATLLMVERKPRRNTL